MLLNYRENNENHINDLQKIESINGISYIAQILSVKNDIVYANALRITRTKEKSDTNFYFLTDVALIKNIQIKHSYPANEKETLLFNKLLHTPNVEVSITKVLNELNMTKQDFIF